MSGMRSWVLGFIYTLVADTRRALAARGVWRPAHPRPDGFGVRWGARRRPAGWDRRRRADHPWPFR
jgi:hypothetical protein